MSIQDTVNADLSKRLAVALNKALSSESEQTSPKAAPSEAPAGRRASNVVELHPSEDDGDDAAPGLSEHWPLPGLAPMTRVRTNFGDVHAIALRKGDEVLTDSGEYLPILWINRIKLDQSFLERRPDSNPIAIGAGALGQEGDLLVSPRQVISAPSLKDDREAAMLVSLPGVRRHHETGLTYTLFHVGEAAQVYCEGLYLSFPIEA